MKGVSSIIAVVMLLMITVSLITVFWAFSNGVFSSITANVGVQTDSSIKRAGSEFTIINAKQASPTTISTSIRNSGTQKLDLDTLVAFVADNPASDSAAGMLSPGDTSSFTVTYNGFTCGTSILRLSVSYAPDAYYIIKC